MHLKTIFRAGKHGAERYNEAGRRLSELPHTDEYSAKMCPYKFTRDKRVTSIIYWNLLTSIYGIVSSRQISHFVNKIPLHQ